MSIQTTLFPEKPPKFNLASPKSRQRFLIVCTKCGITAWAWTATAKFCSKSCQAETLKRQARIICQQCGKGFTVPVGRERTARFCSRPCKSAHARTRISRTCATCGATFDVKINKRYDATYCSKRCYGLARRGAANHNWTGTGKPNARERGRVDFREWRKAVFTRDNWTCRHCGKRGRKMNAHHLMPFASYPEHRFDVANGLTLCLSCHHAVHRGAPRPKAPAIGQLMLFP